MTLAKEYQDNDQIDQGENCLIYQPVLRNANELVGYAYFITRISNQLDMEFGFHQIYTKTPLNIDQAQIIRSLEKSQD